MPFGACKQKPGGCGYRHAGGEERPGPIPKGWTKRSRPDEQSYELVSDGTVLFGYRVAAVPIPERKTESSICFVAVNIYDAKGNLVAESLPDEFRLHTRATIGRGGGIVFG